MAALLVQGDRVLTEEQVRERALGALAEEIRLMLDEGVVAEAQDIDLCMILGAGWPFHLGGITPYLDRTGVAERVTGRRFLPPGGRERPRLSARDVASCPVRRPRDRRHPRTPRRRSDGAPRSFEGGCGRPVSRVEVDALDGRASSRAEPTPAGDLAGRRPAP